MKSLVLLTSSAKTINGKKKETGGNLTLEEKQALYHLSFNNPLCYVDEPADEWKLILAGTFTAMGLMTLGMYVWLSQSEQTEVIGPLSKKIKNLEISSFEENSLVKMS
ncbi:uncharacterized protein CEXT_645681 [Caerostris extrusa]|uniref:Uncharacterized protein n=1 Tax=Caerostris extrusa TaxID=172846 RepID=A0AAV4WJH7_CAEEX|nr:uncharacterized protein CEXT_645681 [Caerostris extrusa]